MQCLPVATPRAGAARVLGVAELPVPRDPWPRRWMAMVGKLEVRVAPTGSPWLIGKIRWEDLLGIFVGKICWDLLGILVGKICWEYLCLEYGCPKRKRSESLPYDHWIVELYALRIFLKAFCRCMWVGSFKTNKSLLSWCWYWIIGSPGGECQSNSRKRFSNCPIRAAEKMRNGATSPWHVFQPNGTQKLDWNNPNGVVLAFAIRIAIQKLVDQP